MKDMRAGAHLDLREVSFRFGGGVTALERVSLHVSEGEFVVLLGPSGCGKTTLLRLMAGLVTPESGRIMVAGRPPRPGRDAAMVFQSFRLLPWKTALQNITFAIPHVPDREARARRYLELVGLSRFAQSYPAALSGGMKQRLALARALAAEPSILLMDEPFASLDAQARELMQQELVRLLQDRPATVVFVTHSVDEALLLADRIVLLSPRPGRVAEEIPVSFARHGDPRGHPEFLRLRQHLWARLRKMVLTDPQSDFFGRGRG